MQILLSVSTTVDYSCSLYKNMLSKIFIICHKDFFKSYNFSFYLFLYAPGI